MVLILIIQRKLVKKMINLILGGGLGNQMFQYAFARTISIETNEKITINTALIDKTNINFDLKDMNILEDISVESDIDKFQQFKKNIYFKGHKFLKHIYSSKTLYKRNIKKGIYTNFHGSFKFYNIPKFLGEEKTIHGGFQSVKFFEKHQDIIKNELKLKNDPDESNKKMIEQISSCNSVCVHIRRGDYLNPEFKDILGFCTEKYYQNAIEKMNTLVEEPVYYVFSNNEKELNFIKDNYNLKGNIIYVNQKNSGQEDLRLMYSCKHFIIANSSLSWWGQFLGEYKNKVVIAPNKWDKEKNIDDKDIYMSHWIKVAYK